MLHYEQLEFSRKDLEALQYEHNQLEDVFNSSALFKNSFAAEKASMSFEKAWRLQAKTYPLLYQLAGVLAPVFPGTSRVENDFSIINWEKNMELLTMM